MVMKFAKYFKTPFICMNKIHMLFPISSRSITNTVRLQVVLLIHYWKEKIEEKLLGSIKKQSKKPLNNNNTMLLSNIRFV